MSVLSEQITKVLREHDLKNEVWSWFECECGAEQENYDGWQAHVASALEAALHLETILVKEGEAPPLYGINGWFRGVPVPEEQP